MQNFGPNVRIVRESTNTARIEVRTETDWIVYCSNLSLDDAVRSAWNCMSVNNRYGSTVDSGYEV
jgi:hypothetical protein